ncbi:MAG: hypothetical protein JW787_08315 [Sedimentisphaerales bacterium]|nr:hypothetical protein [Sedimentisphaerales bacterium]
MKRKLFWISTIIGLIVVVLTAMDFLNNAGDVKNPEDQLAKMLPAERDFCQQILWQIDSGSNERDVLALLGPPARSLKLKKIWHVKLDGKADRVSVYFGIDGLATQVVLDGGFGRFYYRRSVNDHEKPRRESSQPTNPTYLEPASQSPQG